MSLVALVAALLVQPSSVHPWPIGPGPRYVPPAAPAAVRAGRPVGSLPCSRGGAWRQLHVELFANRRVVVLPAGIGVAEPFRPSAGAVVPGGCSYPVRTRTPTGVVEVRAGNPLRLRDLFRIWGQRLGARRLGSFTSVRPVRVYVGGRLVAGPPGAVPLTRHAQIVVELGAYLSPHPFFLFTGGARP